MQLNCQFECSKTASFSLVKWAKLTIFSQFRMNLKFISAQIKYYIQKMEQQTQILDRKGQNNRVKVAIRVRPFVQREKVLRDNSCMQIVSNTQIILGNQKLFKFDQVFEQSSQQFQVYDSCVRNLVLQCFEGYNAAILAYGQTGSGKTYTMGTTSSQKMAHQERGILPRVIGNIFQQVHRNSQRFKYSIKSTFLEIYNEHIVDLLSEGHSTAKNSKDNSMIAIRQEKDGSVSIYGANQELVKCQEEMLELLDRGSFHRTTSSTLMNEASSRSHAIFTITIERNSLGFNNQFGVDEKYVTAKFVFVDLAGSERVKKTGATGNTLKEGININLGLLELGNVISSLAIQKKQYKFINYRNSKLTRILQDSLGGNSNTYMIACVSPAESNYEQSLNSIKYASKAMNIKNKPVINRDPQQAHILKLKGIISDLQKQNDQLKKAMSERGIDVSKVASTSLQRAQSLTYLTQSEGISRLKTRNAILQKKCESLLIQTKQQTKKTNQLEIALYETRRAKDILEMKIQKLLKGQPISEDDAAYTPVVESYLNKIQFLDSQIHQKQKSISQLQIQYSKLYDSSGRDAIILTKKNEKIFGLQRKVKQLQKKVVEVRSEADSKSSKNLQVILTVQKDGQFDQRGSIYEQIDESCIDQLQSEANLECDSQYLSQISNHQTEHHKLDTQIKHIEKTIQDREAFYADINEQQINLQYKLIEEMKQQYHQKINQLQKQREKLLSSNRRENGRNEEKNIGKIQNLEYELRQLKKKAREQKQLQKQVSLQSGKLKQLGQEINSFRMQKIELNRKMKEEKDKFNKFKNKRIKELFEARKQNVMKQGQIRKLKNQNKKYLQQAVKKKQQMKRMKKVNDTLKQLMKPKRVVRGSLAVVGQPGKFGQRGQAFSASLINSRRDPKKQVQVPSLSQQEYDCIISESIKSILLQIDRQTQSHKILSKCNQIQKQIQQLKQEQSSLNIRKQRLQLKKESTSLLGQEINTYQDLEKQEEERVLLEQLIVKLNQISDRLVNLEQDLEFKISRYDDLLISSEKKYFNYQTEIIYNKKYQSVQCFRSIITSLYRSIMRILSQNLNLKQQTDTLKYESNQMSYEISKFKEQVFNLNVECQQKIEQAREQYMQLKIQLQLWRDNRNNQLNQLQNYSAIGNETNKLSQPFGTYQKNQDQVKKKYEKKIEELNKNNKAMLKQLEVQRKKCQIVTQKYNNLKSLLNKDKFIGITVKQEDQSGSLNSAFNQHFNSGFRDRRQQSLVKQQNQTQYHHSDDCVNQIKQRDCFETRKRRFPQTIRQISENSERKSTQFTDLQFNKNNWQLAAQITSAHKSPILSLAAHDNILASTASKSVAVWDLQSNQLIHQISGGINSSFVKSVVIHPQRQIMFTTSDKNINVWDLRTFKSQMVLKGHKDQIRLLHINGDTLFSAGKGTVNGGSLLVWDLRGRMSFQNIIEKQRNQDIFSMASQDGVLYYGTRDHFVRRMKIQNNQTLLAFQPPHMDTVTGLATLGDYLISGSKDKNLRLWSLQSSMYNLKSTVHSFNEYITFVQSDDYLPLFYASDRSGQIKIGTVIKQKIQFVGGILAHSQQINSICKLNVSPRRGLFATGSSDKSIKIWRPSAQTLEHILNDY